MAASRGFRRAIALSLLVLAGVVIWRAAAQPAWRAWQADREAVAQHRDSIARLRGIAAARGEYEAALEKLRGETGVADALIDSPSDTLAAAELQQRVKLLVERAGGSLVSAQPNGAQPAGPFTRVGLSVRMLISTPALQQVLYALEAEAPVVVIDELLVLARGGRSARRRMEAASELDVRVQLASFMRPAPAGGSVQR